MGKNPPAVWETWVPSPGWEEPLEEGVATHCSVLAWRIPADRGAWRAVVRGVTDSRTWLSGQAQHRGRAQETLLSSTAVSRPGVSDSAAPGTAALQASLAFPVLGVCTDSRLLSQRCHPTIVPFSSRPQSFPASSSLLIKWSKC